MIIPQLQVIPNGALGGGICLICPCRATVGHRQPPSGKPIPEICSSQTTHPKCDWKTDECIFYIARSISIYIYNYIYYISIYIYVLHTHTYMAVWNYQRVPLLFSSDVLKLVGGNWPHWRVQLNRWQHFPSQTNKLLMSRASDASPQGFPARQISWSLGGGHAMQGIHPYLRVDN